MDGDTHLGRSASIRAQAQPVIDHLLDPVDGRAGPGPLRVAGSFLPGCPFVLGDALQMAVSLRRPGLGRLARNGSHVRGHDDRRIGAALGDGGSNALLIVGAVGGGGRRRSWHLIGQGADLGTVVDALHGQQRSDDLPGIGVQADVQLARGPARFGAMLLDQLLARAAELSS